MMTAASGWLSDEEYRQTYSLVPRLCVDLVIVCGCEVALVRRKQQPYCGYWHLPGGRVNFREPLLEALRRIGRAEVGQEIGIARCQGFMEFLHDKGDLGDFHSVSLVFQTELDRFDAEGVGWFSTAPMDIHPTHRAFLLAEGLLAENLRSEGADQ